MNPLNPNGVASRAVVVLLQRFSGLSTFVALLTQDTLARPTLG